jgi:hypothetical protein
MGAYPVTACADVACRVLKKMRSVTVRPGAQYAPKWLYVIDFVSRS